MKVCRIARLGTLSLAAICLTGLSAISQAQDTRTARLLKVGAAVPDCVLRGMDGNEVKLRQVIKGKNTVLVFYAGGNAQLTDLQTIQSRLNNRGYQLVAISVDAPQELNQLANQDHLSYRLLSDPTAETLAKFGVAMRPNGVRPEPAVFLTNTKGGVTYVRTNPDLKASMSGAEILKVIDAMPWPIDTDWDDSAFKSKPPFQSGGHDQMNHGLHASMRSTENVRVIEAKPWPIDADWDDSAFKSKPPFQSRAND